jgi:hypothetical protein
MVRQQLPADRFTVTRSAPLCTGAVAEFNLMHVLLLLFCAVSATVPPVPETLFGVAEILLVLLLMALMICGVAQPLPRTVGQWEHSARNAVLLLMAAWLISSVNLFLHDELTLEGYLRGLTPFLGFVTFRAGQHFRSQRSAFVLVRAVTIAGLLSAILGSIQAIRDGVIDPGDMSSSIHFRSLLNSKSYDALVLSLPVALIGGGLVGTSRVSRLFVGLGVLAFLFSMLTLMRSGVVIAAVVLLFEAVMILRASPLRRRFCSRAPVIVVLVMLLEAGSWISAIGGIRVPSVFRAIGAIGERHQRNVNQVDDGFQSYRLVEAAAAWERFTESPVFGHGLGSTFSVVLDGPFAHVDRQAMRYTHNFFTYMLYTGGIIGIFATVRFFHVALRVIIQGARLAARSSEPGVDMALVLLVLGMLVYIQFQSMFRSSTYFMMLGLVFGCLAARTSILASAAVSPSRPKPSETQVSRRSA